MSEHDTGECGGVDHCYECAVLEIARLRANELRKLTMLNDRIVELEAALAAEVEKVRIKDDALRPFAEWCKEFPQSAGEDLYVYHARTGTQKFTRSMCLNAKKALSSSAPSGVESRVEVKP